MHLAWAGLASSDCMFVPPSSQSASSQSNGLLSVRFEYQEAVHTCSRHGQGRYDWPPPDAITHYTRALQTAEQSSSSLVTAMLTVQLSVAEVGLLRASGYTQSIANSNAVGRLAAADAILDERNQGQDGLFTLTAQEWAFTDLDASGASSGPDPWRETLGFETALRLTQLFLQLASWRKTKRHP